MLATACSSLTYHCGNESWYLCDKHHQQPPQWPEEMFTSDSDITVCHPRGSISGASGATGLGRIKVRPEIWLAEMFQANRLFLFQRPPHQPLVSFREDSESGIQAEENTAVDRNTRSSLWTTYVVLTPREYRSRLPGYRSERRWKDHKTARRRSTSRMRFPASLRVSEAKYVVDADAAVFG